MSSLPLAQRRQLELDDLQPVVQILAEARPCSTAFLEIAVRGRYDPDVDLEWARGPADALEGTLLQHAQNLGLGLGLHVADLVEEDRAAVGRFEAALAATRRRR